MRTSWERVKQVLALSHKIAFQRSFLLTCLRDGPLEKLWWGWGIFEPQEFFFVIKFLVWIFFRPWHEYFLGLIGAHDFFSFNFPLLEYFFLYFTSPPPNAPSLKSFRHVSKFSKCCTSATISLVKLFCFSRILRDCFSNQFRRQEKDGIYS